MNNDKFKIKIASASCNQTAMDWPRNVKNIKTAIKLAVKDRADILCLEELTLTGYECGDNFYYLDNQKTYELLYTIATYAKELNPNLIISVGHTWYFADKNLASQPERRKNPLFNRINNHFNVQSIIAGGKIVAMSAKRYLFNYERGYEKRHFEEWSENDANRYEGSYHGTIEIELPTGRKIPFGAPVIELYDSDKNKRANINHVMCEEYWVGSKFDNSENNSSYEQDNPLAQKARYFDITIAINPNASPPEANKIEKHKELCKLASKYCSIFVHTDGLGSSGSSFAQFGSRIMAQNGKIISEGKRCSFKDVAYTSQIVEVNSAKDKGNKPHRIIEHCFADEYIQAVQDGPAKWEYGEYQEFEEELRCECLWLFDYARKNKIHGFVEALSGGADSGYNATKVRVMIELAISELGIEGFFVAMPYLKFKDEAIAMYKDKGKAEVVNFIMQNMLTCVYMGTDNSSENTLNAAKALATGIGAKFEYKNLQELLETYAKIYSGKDSHSINEMNPVAYENIQARMRQVLIMLYANVENKLAIANPNLDEGRNSYATWGGDLHGGMVSGNAHKNKQRQLDHMKILMERGLSEDVKPIKALELTLKNKPSAELQPKDKSGKVTQFDEEQLGRSFEQMDVISYFMLYERPLSQNGRRNSPIEVFKKCKNHPAFKNDSLELLHNRIQLSYQKWAHAQFKIHGSPVAATYGRNVDHQLSMRTPNISSNFRPELVQLAIYVLEKIALRDDKEIETLTKSLYKKALLEQEFIDSIFSKMWDSTANDGLPIKIEKLYEYILSQTFE